MHLLALGGRYAQMWQLQQQSGEAGQDPAQVAAVLA
jgi:hypothetical protein